MKKYLVILFILILFPINVMAAGGFSVSPKSITMYPGETKTFTISTNNAVGKLDIASSNASIAAVDLGSVFIQNPGASQIITITAKSVGTSTISVVASSDFATMDEEILSGKKETVTINVINKPSTPTNPPQQNNNLSKNNNLKELTIDGHEVNKIDDNNYVLTVSNDVKDINIEVKAEDSKAIVSGAGIHELDEGENTIEIIITSESGDKNKIVVSVVRKDGYYLEDISRLLKDSNVKDIDIIINANDILTSEQLKLIKDSNKVVKLNCYNDNKEKIYSWIIDGNKLDSFNATINLGVNVNYSADYNTKLYEASNYADGIHLNIKSVDKLPLGIRFLLYTNNRFENKDKVNLYEFNASNNELNLVTNLALQNGYVEFDLANSGDYFITLSNIANNVSMNNNLIMVYATIAVIELIIIMILTVLSFVKYKKSKNSY